MLSRNGLCQVSNFFRRRDFRALGDYSLRDISSVPDLYGHRCPWMVLGCMNFKVILNGLLEFSEIDCTLHRNNLEMKLYFLLWIRPGCFHEHKPDLIVAQVNKWDALAL